MAETCSAKCGRPFTTLSGGVEGCAVHGIRAPERGGMWIFMFRHPSHPAGEWECGKRLYETRQQAAAAARSLWAGTAVTRRLISIPTVLEVNIDAGG